MLKFDTSAFSGEVPVRLGVTDIAVVLPGSDFVDERLFVGKAAVEALGGKDAKFGFRQIKPTAVLRRVMPFEPFRQPARLGRRKSLIERGGFVRAEIIWTCPGSVER